MVAGAIAGVAVYVTLVLTLAVAGFDTLSIGTACFVALIVWALLAWFSVPQARRRGSDFKRQWQLFLLGMLGFHVLSYIYVIAFVGELIAFRPH